MKKTSTSRGYFGIGIFEPKTEMNVGTLWRSAYQLGASFIFTIGKKYKKQSSDTCKAPRHIPLFQYGNFEDFKKSLYDCIPILIEFNKKSIPLTTFIHPKRCVYILGSEDNGFSNEVLEDVETHLEIESKRIESYNVAMAGTIVMYHRLITNMK